MLNRANSVQRAYPTIVLRIFVQICHLHLVLFLDLPSLLQSPPNWQRYRNLCLDPLEISQSPMRFGGDLTISDKFYLFRRRFNPNRLQPNPPHLTTKSI